MEFIGIISFAFITGSLSNLNYKKVVAKIFADKVTTYFKYFQAKQLDDYMSKVLCKS